jgi:hypothetical protein
MSIINDFPAAPNISCWVLVSGQTYKLNSSKPACVDGLGLPTLKLTRSDNTKKYQLDRVDITEENAAVVSEAGPVSFQDLSNPLTFGGKKVVIATKEGKAGLVTGVTIDPPPGKPDAAPPKSCGFLDRTSFNRVEAFVQIYLPTRSTWHVPPRNVMRPNQGLTVEICHRRSENVSVEWGGERGLTQPSMVAAGQAPTLYSADVSGAPPVTEPVVMSTFSFSPRRAGSADIKVTTTASSGDGDAPASNPHVVELQIDSLSWGSARFGVGTLIDVNNQWKTYQIATMAGSSQPEIRQFNSAMGFELVTGFAPYLFDDLIWGGRSQTGGGNTHLAPYFGFGVFGAALNQGTQAFSSFHLGLEIEFFTNFSVATTVAIRRTPVLADGYRPGSPVAPTQSVGDVTGDGWHPGFGIVINASPDFLQFATPASTKASKPTSMSSSSAGKGANSEIAAPMAPPAPAIATPPPVLTAPPTPTAPPAPTAPPVPAGDPANDGGE